MNKKILYFAHHALGDIITQIPAINFLIEKFGNDNIYFTVQFEYLLDFLSEYFKIPKNNFYLKKGNFDTKQNNLQFILALRKEKFEYFIPAPIFGLNKVKFFMKLLNVHNTLLPEKSYSVNFKHKVLKNLEFIKNFDEVNNTNIIDYANKNYILREEFYNDSNIEDYIDNQYIVIHIGCAVSEIFKRLPLAKYKYLINKILENTDYKIILTGVGFECSDIDILCNYIESKKLINTCDKLDLKQLMKLIKFSKCVISADTGIAHLSSILDKKNFIFIGPTDEKITGPFTNSEFIKVNHELDCMPCYGTKKYGIKGCSEIKCMNNISEDTIVNKILGYLK
ncbi:glycosyltransferase family 9 protein [bacterium]|jgi:ADP-heptose:LPS heptosyltransferase|nr:glycosyltransferase family 9 protein [bacterium]